jgi:hypothetical protein
MTYVKCAERKARPPLRMKEELRHSQKVREFVSVDMPYKKW